MKYIVVKAKTEYRVYENHIMYWAAHSGGYKRLEDALIVAKELNSWQERAEKRALAQKKELA